MDMTEEFAVDWAKRSNSKVADWVERQSLRPVRVAESLAPLCSEGTDSVFQRCRRAPATVFGSYCSEIRSA